MNAAIAILFTIGVGLLYPTWLQHHARGWKFAAFWAAPVVGFFFGFVVAR